MGRNRNAVTVFEAKKELLELFCSGWGRGHDRLLWEMEQCIKMIKHNALQCGWFDEEREKVTGKKNLYNFVLCLYGTM